MTQQYFQPDATIDGRYKIIEFHREGGMQQVYKAIDTRLNKIVAIKIPKNRSSMKRFSTSAVASARVNNPFVAKALDYIPQLATDIFVEEFIDGLSLDEYLNDYFFYFDPHIVTSFSLQLISGIAASHNAGVIHRDIKPANIMVLRNEGKFILKITDFGIAKLTESFFSVESITAPQTSSTILGAIPYMAPEVIHSPENASFASDIWSFGALLYHILFGKHPFGFGPSAVETILSGEKPSFEIPFSGKIQFESLFNQLISTINKCLSPDINQRPSALELKQELASFCFSDVPYKDDVLTSKGTYGNWGFTQEGFFVHPDSFWGKPEIFQTNTPLFFGTLENLNRAFPIIPLRQRL